MFQTVTIRRTIQAFPAQTKSSKRIFQGNWVLCKSFLSTFNSVRAKYFIFKRFILFSIPLLACVNQVLFYKITPFLLVFYGLDICYWSFTREIKKNDMQNEMTRRPIISTAPWKFSVESKVTFSHTPLWHVRVIVISLFCLQVTVGCTNIAFLHFSEMLQQRK